MLAISKDSAVFEGLIKLILKKITKPSDGKSEAAEAAKNAMRKTDVGNTITNRAAALAASMQD